MLNGARCAAKAKRFLVSHRALSSPVFLSNDTIPELGSTNRNYFKNTSKCIVGTRIVKGDLIWLRRPQSRCTSLSNNYKFPIPELKVGTLDSLVGLSDELGKLDTFVEGIVKKLAQYTADIMEDSKDKAQENLLANGVDLHRYVTHFQWDMAKYPIKQSLQNITEVIAKVRFGIHEKNCHLNFNKLSLYL
ncbi:hypothetical protein scyTo_0012483 [Scyliorhinus torazame]|uniref:V-type proton ATPase subunit C n=1 Tax=Scyliorhinus torazame TaxID=75743 RepID=A0A401P9B1_SCYTO|nr:hypothetical protein [Scyliorhinus torazame]